MKPQVKLADVARAAGVSQGTASNVFNRPQLVRPEVRERVEATALRLGYAGPDPRGRVLRAGKVNAIGVVVYDEMAYFFSDPFARLMMEGVAEVCDEKGAGLALVSARSKEEVAWGIQTAVVDGFILNCLEDGDRLIAETRRRKLPFVAVDFDAGPGVNSIVIDDRRGAGMAARHVLELGHRRIGVLALDLREDDRYGWVDRQRLAEATYMVDRDRLHGIADALGAFGIPFESVPVIESPNDRRAAIRYLDDILGRQPDTTAILCLSDILALGVIEGARQRGLDVPGDLSVTGFDDIPEAALASPPLTTIRQPIKERGRKAAELIFAAEAPRKVILDVELVVRQSTAPPAPDHGNSGRTGTRP